jgi:hypothetical protein
VLILVEGTHKNELEPDQEGIGEAAELTRRQEILDQNRPVCWTVILKENRAVGSLFFRGVFF